MSCFVCGKPFGGLDLNAQQRHVNACLDSQARGMAAPSSSSRGRRQTTLTELGPIKKGDGDDGEAFVDPRPVFSPPATNRLDSDKFACVACGKDLSRKKRKGRVEHLIKCADLHGLDVKTVAEVVTPGNLAIQEVLKPKRNPQTSKKRKHPEGPREIRKRILDIDQKIIALRKEREQLIERLVLESNVCRPQGSDHSSTPVITRATEGKSQLLKPSSKLAQKYENQNGKNSAWEISRTNKNVPLIPFKFEASIQEDTSQAEKESSQEEQESSIQESEPSKAMHSGGNETTVDRDTFERGKISSRPPVLLQKDPDVLEDGVPIQANTSDLSGAHNLNPEEETFERTKAAQNTNLEEGTIDLRPSPDDEEAKRAFISLLEDDESENEPKPVEKPDRIAEEIQVESDKILGEPSQEKKGEKTRDAKEREEECVEEPSSDESFILSQICGRKVEEKECRPVFSEKIVEQDSEVNIVDTPAQHLVEVSQSEDMCATISSAGFEAKGLQPNFKNDQPLSSEEPRHLPRKSHSQRAHSFLKLDVDALAEPELKKQMAKYGLKAGSINYMIRKLKMLQKNVAEEQQEAMDVAKDSRRSERQGSRDQKSKNTAKSNSKDARESLLREYIFADDSLYEKAVLFEPLDLNIVSAKLRDSGISCGKSSLLKFFDSEGISVLGNWSNKQSH